MIPLDFSSIKVVEMKIKMRGKNSELFSLVKK